MTRLDDRARPLIEAARTEAGLDAEAKAEGRARLGASLAAAGLAAAAVTAGSRTAAAAGWSLGAKVIAGGSVILAGGALYALSLAPRDLPALGEAQRGSSPAAVAPAAPSVAPAPGPTSAPEPIAEPVLPQGRVVSASQRPSHLPPAPSSRPDVATSLAADVKLLRDVRAALAAGQPNVALGLLQARRADPDPGGLAPEREAARLVTLCRLGRAEEARRAAQSFFRAHPGSPLATRIREECP